MRRTIVGLAAVLLASILLGAAPSHGAVTVTNSPASVDESSTTLFSLSVTHEGPAADSVCTVRLTANAAFTGISAVNVPAGWTSSVVGQVITWTADPGNCLKAIVDDVTQIFPWQGTAPSVGGAYSHAWQTTGGAGSGNVSTLVNEPVFTASTKGASDLNGAPLRPGETVRYSLTIRNTGNMTASNVSVADTLQAVFVGVAGVTGGGVVDLGPPIVITWNLGSMNPGATVALQFDATLDAPIDNNTVVSNRAVVRSDQTAPFYTPPANLSVTSAPSFAASTKSWTDLNGGLLQPGDTLSYSMVVPNTGDMHATGVTLIDALPAAGIDYVTGSTTLNGAGVADQAGVSPIVAGLLINSPGEPAGRINVGESASVSVRMKIRSDVNPGTVFNNMFNLTSAQGVNGSAAAPPATVLGAAHGLAAQLPATASSCDELEYVLTFTASTSVAFDTWFESLLASGLDYVPGSAEVTNSGQPGVNTDDPEIAGSMLRFNYAGAPNPGDDPIWDVDPGEALTIRFRLRVTFCAPGQYSVTSSANYRPGLSAPYTLLTPAAESRATVLQGALVITDTPVAPPAAVNDIIFYTIRVKSVGFGAVGNVEVSDSLRTGLRLVPSQTVPAPTSWVLNPDSTTSIRWDPTVGSLARLDPGEEQVITLAARLVSCTDYDNIATATWGCEAIPCQTKTATASVNLLLNEPQISFALNPSPIPVPACDAGGVPVTFTVTNAGGEARDMDLFMSGFPAGLVIEDVSGATYIPGSPATFELGTLLENEVRDITFRVVHIDNCASPSGTLVFTTRYTNLCGDPYTFTALIGSVSTQSLPGLTLSKSGPVEILAGTTDTWTISVCFAPGAPADTVWVDDSYPAGFSFVGDEDPPAFTGGDPGSTATSWFFLPADFAGDGCVEITYSLLATGACGTEGTNAATASTSVPCGAVLCGSSGSGSALTAIDCPDNTTSCVTTMLHTVNGAQGATEEVCVPMTHEVTIQFPPNPEPGFDFTDLVFKAQARHGKTLVGVRQLDGTWAYGKARFAFTDSLGQSCALDLEPVRDGNNELSWDLAPLEDLDRVPGCGIAAPPELAGGTLVITYDLVSDAAIAYHYEFARLVIDGGPGFACNSSVEEPVQVTVTRSTMGVGIGIATTAERCVAVAVPIDVAKSGAYGSYDNVLYLSTEGWEYIDDPSDPGFFLPVFSGGLPNVGMPTRVNDVGDGSPGVMWLLGDLPPGFNSGSILVPLRKRCANLPAYARLVYDDRCGNDDTNNIDQNSLEATASASPALVLSADVTLKLTPLTYFVTEDTAEWTLYCINGGAGAVENLDITSSTPGAGIAFTQVELLDQNGVPRPDELHVTFGSNNRSVNYVIDRIPAGETWRARIRAEATGCDQLTHDVSGFWGCGGDTCQAGPQLTQRGAVDFPPAVVIADIVGDVNIASCGVTSVTTEVKNASLVRVREGVYHLQLPSGVTYVDNSTMISIDHLGGATEPDVTAPSGNAADPVVSGQELIWVLEHYLSTEFLSPEDVVTIACQLRADPAFAGGVLDAVGTYADECGRPAFMTADQVPVTTTPFDAAALTIDTAFDSLQACTVAGVDDNLLVLTVENPTGNGTAYGVMIVTATLPEGSVYSDFSTNITYPTAGGTGAHTTNPSISGTGAPGNPQRLRWTLPSTVQMDGGDDLVVRFRILHTGDTGCLGLPDGLVLTIEGERCPPGVPDGDSFSLDLEPIPLALRRPDLQLEIVALDRTPNGGTVPGDTIQAIAVVRNMGAGWSRDRTLRMQIDPAQLTFLSSTPAADGAGGGLYTWSASLPDLSPGAIDSVHVFTRVAQNVPLGAIIAVDGDLTDDCCGDEDEDRTYLTVNGAAHLDIEKFSTDAVIVPGGTVTYEIFVQNDGGQTLQNVVVTETPNLPGLTYNRSQFDSLKVAFTGTAAAPRWTIARTASNQPKFQPGATEIIRLSYNISTNHNQIGTPAGIGYVYNRASITSVENALGNSLTGSDVLDSDGERVPVSVQGAGLDIQKVAVQGLIEPGELVTFLLRVTNIGGQNLTNVVVTDPIPPGLTLLTTQYDTATTVVTSLSPPTFTIASLPIRNQQQIALTFRASINAGDLGANVVNTASATGRDQGNGVVNATPSQISVPVQLRETSLDIDKVATTGTAEPGGAVTYTLSAMNDGLVGLTNVVVVDTPPVGLTYAGSQFGAGVSLTSTAPPTFAIASLPAGSLEQIAITFDVDEDPDAVPDPVVNRATGSGVDPSGNPVTADPAESRIPRGTPAPALDVAKIALDPALVPGLPVSYLITAQNTGNVPLSDVLITDPSPTGLTYRSSSYDGDVSLVTSSPPTYRIADLPVGAVEVFSITFDTPVDPTALDDPTVNIVGAQGTAPGGAVIPAVPDTARIAVEPAPAGLDLDKVATTGVTEPGGTVTWQLHVRNIGSVDLSDVIVIDTPPAGLTFVSAQYGSGVTQTSVAPPTFRIASLPAYVGEIIALTFDVSADTGALTDPVINRASASGTTPGGDTVSVGPIQNALPLAVPGNGLNVRKVATESFAFPGASMTYLLTVTNTGEQELTDVDLVDIPPTGLTYEYSQYNAATVTQTGTAPPSWRIATLAPHAFELISVTFTTPENPNDMTDPVVNRAAGSGLDPSGGTVEADTTFSSVPRLSGEPRLDVAKIALDPALVPGLPVSYLITAQNTGNVPLSDVLITDPSPTGLTYRSSSYDGDVSLVTSSPPTYRIADLPVGAVEVFSITFDTPVDPTALDDPTVNIVGAQGTAPGGAVIPAVPDTALVAVEPAPAGLDLDKVATTGVVEPGGTVTWQLHVRNIGSVDLSDVVVIDTPPAGLTFVSAQYGSGVTQTSVAPPTFQIATLPAYVGEIIALTFDVSADTGALTDPVINRASASGTTPGGDTVSVGPIQNALPLAVPGNGLNVRKVATESFAFPGASLTYLLTVTNTGEQELTDVDLVDIPPTGLTYEYSQYNAATVTQTGTAPPSWRIATLAPHDFELISVTFTTPENPNDMTDPVVNRAAGSGLDPSGGTVEADTTFSSVPQGSGEPRIDIEKSALTLPITAGSEASWLLTLINTGGTSLSSISVTDILPEGLSYLTADPPAVEAPAGTLTWTLADLEPGQHRQIALTTWVSPLAGPNITNTAGVTGTAPGGSVVTDTDAATAPVRLADSAIQIDKTPTTGFLVLGGQVTYILTLSNEGAQPLSGVSVTDPLPQGTVFASSDLDPARWSLVTTEPVTRWDLIGLLNPGESEQITLSLNGAADLAEYGLAAGDTTLVNTARVTAIDPQAAPVEDLDEARVSINVPRGAVLLNKTATVGEVVPGQQVTYLLTVENVGDQDLFPLEVREPDLADQGLTFVASDFDSVTFSLTESPTGLIWSSRAAYLPGSREQIRITYRATTNLDSLANPIINVATAVGDDESGQVVIDSDSEGLPLKVLTAGLSVNKSAAQGQVTPGELATWTVTVANTGELPLHDVRLQETDLAPQGMEFFEARFDSTVWQMADSLTWVSRDTLAVGAIEILRMTYRASAYPIDLPLRVVNSVRLDGTDLYGRAWADSADESLPVLVPGASVDLQKEATAAALLPGQRVTWLLTLTNNGRQELLSATVTDTLPPGCSAPVSDHDAAKLSFSVNGAVVEWTLNTPLLPGESETIRLTAETSANAADLLDPTVNRAVVRAVAANGDPLIASDSATLTLQLPFAALSVAKIPAQNVVTPGDPHLYTLLVENRGDTPLHDVEVIESPPAGLQYESSEFDSVRVIWTGTVDAPRWSIASLPVGAQVVIQVRFRAAADPLLIANPAFNRVTAAGLDPSGRSAADEAESALPVRLRDARIRVEKIALEPVVTPGAPMSWEIRVTNVGADSLFDVIVVDELPRGFADPVSTHDPARAQFSMAPKPTWTLTGPLAPGDLFGARLTAVASSNEADLADPVENAARASATNRAGASVADLASESVPLAESRPAVNIQKSTTMPVVTAGRPIAYTITVTNTGDRDLFDLLVRDVVPSGLSFASSYFDAVHVSFSGTPSNPSWSIARLPRGELETITVRFDAEANDAAIPDPVVNLAGVRGHDASGTEVEDSDDESTPLQAGAPALHIDKVATTGALEPGGEVTYLLTVLNAGTEALTDIRVEDPTPTELAYRASQFDAVHVLETTASGVASWFIPRLPVGGFEQIRVTFGVDPDLAAPRTVLNTASAVGIDGRGGAVADADDESLPVAEPRPALHIDKSATQGSIVPGEEVTYLLTVTNNGDAPLRQLIVEDRPDSSLIYLTSNFDNRNVAIVSTIDPVRWSIARLEPGGIEQIRVTWRAGLNLATAGAPESIVNWAGVQGSTIEGTLASDDDEELLPVRRQPASIQILKWTDFTGRDAYADREVAYHLFVVNTGPQRLADVTATDYLPPALAFREADLTPATVGDPGENDGGHAIWNIGALDPQEAWEVLVVTRIRSALPTDTVLMNRAVAAGTDPAGILVRDEDSVRVQIRVPHVAVDKSVDRAQARPGEAVTYRVTWRNLGGIEARAVVVVDEIPEGTTYVGGSATGGAVYQPEERRIVADVGTLPPDAVGSFTYQVRLSESLRPRNRVPNVATIYAQDLEPELSDTVWVGVSDAPLSLRKFVDLSVASAGDTLTYTLVWSVAGSAALGDVVVEDVVPGLTQYVPGSSIPPAEYDPVLQRLSWRLGRLAAGSVGTLTYRLAIDPAAEAGRVILNDASIRAAGIAPIESNGVLTVLVPPARLAIEKQVDRTVAEPGDTLAFSLIVENREDRPVREIVLTDVLPPEVIYLEGSAEGAVFDGTRLQWSLGTLLPGDRRIIRFRATVRDGVPSGTQIVNLAQAVGADAVAVESNVVLTLVLYTKIDLVKTANRAEASAGTKVTYTVTARNSGNARAADLILHDARPGGFEYVEGSSRITRGEATVPLEPIQLDPLRWAVGNLDPGGEIRLAYDLLVGSGAAEGSRRNCVTVSGLGLSGDTLRAGPACADLNVVAPHLVVTKTTPERTVEPGELVLYTVTLRNPSRSDLRAVMLVDRPPMGFQLVRRTARLDGNRLADPEGDGPYHWSIGELPAGASRTLEYDMIVGLNAPTGVAPNIAEAEGLDALGASVRAGPVDARVTVLHPQRPAAVQGWVFIDCDEDGQPDSANVVRSGVPGIELLIEDGRRVRTDDQGGYFIYPLERGDHLIRLDRNRLSSSARVVGPSDRFFYAIAGGRARVNFRICLDEKEGILRFAKSVSTDRVSRRTGTGEPERFTLGGFLFDTARATLRPEADPVLREIAERLKSLPDATGRVEGHTDIRPIQTAQFPDNYALSVARAESVRQALIQRFGIAASRLSARGFGPDRPVADGYSEEDWQRNRRVEILIDDPSGGEPGTGGYDPEEVEYRLTLVYAGEVPLTGLVVEDRMPEGLSFIPGSSREDGQPASDPVIEQAGGTTLLRWTLGDAGGGFQRVIAYRARVESLPDDGGLTNEASVRWIGGSGETEATAAVGATIRLGAETDSRTVRYTLDGVLFDTGRANLRPEADAVLRRVLEAVRGLETPRLIVEGHTDDRPIRWAEFRDNQALSEARARTVADWLAREAGLDPSSIEVRGFGPTRPAATNATPEGRQANRRVEVEATGRSVKELIRPSAGPATRGQRPSETESRVRSTAHERAGEVERERVGQKEVGN